MHAYDAARFDPPAPLALVAITSEQLVIRDIPMLLYPALLKRAAGNDGAYLKGVVELDSPA